MVRKFSSFTWGCMRFKTLLFLVGTKHCHNHEPIHSLCNGLYGMDFTTFTCWRVWGSVISDDDHSIPVNTLLVAIHSGILEFSILGCLYCIFFYFPWSSLIFLNESRLNVLIFCSRDYHGTMVSKYYWLPKDIYLTNDLFCNSFTVDVSSAAMQ